MRRQIVVGLALALAIGMGMLPSTQASAYRGYGTYLPRAYGYAYYRPRMYPGSMEPISAGCGAGGAADGAIARLARSITSVGERFGPAACGTRQNYEAIIGLSIGFFLRGQ